MKVCIIVSRQNNQRFVLKSRCLGGLIAGRGNGNDSVLDLLECCKMLTLGTHFIQTVCFIHFLQLKLKKLESRYGK